MTSSAGASRRQASAFKAAAAAKRRRQKIFMIVGLILFAGILAYELPHTLKLLKTKSSPTAASSPSNTASSPPASQGLPKALRGSVSDPFAARSLVSGDPQVGAADPSNDPFRTPAAAPATSAPAVTALQPLPEQIVIGTPGANRTAQHGWIVILASIPTREGRDKAVRVAGQARAAGVDPVAVLNSSTRRPLRGGYWVVYTGPFDTLAAVVHKASSVHADGYRTAYLRELIVYR